MTLGDSVENSRFDFPVVDVVGISTANGDKAALAVPKKMLKHLVEHLVKSFPVYKVRVALFPFQRHLPVTKLKLMTQTAFNMLILCIYISVPSAPKPILFSV